MAELISMVTYDAQTVTPQDDALVYETAIGAGGVIYGCTATIKNSNTLHISAGHGVLCGRKFTVVDGDIPIQLAQGASLNGRLYIHLDLGNPEPIQLLVETGSTLTPPVHDADVNIINGVYDLDLYTFSVSPTTIGDLVKVYDVVKPSDDQSHKQVLHAFPVNVTATTSGWILQSGGTWNGYYKNTKTGVRIHHPSAHVRASGATLDTPPTDSVKGAVSNMYFEADDEAGTLTAYTKSAPTETIYISVEGVE